MADWLALARNRLAAVAPIISGKGAVLGTANTDETLVERYAANDEASRCWRITYPNSAAVLVVFVPAATGEQVQAIYKGAMIEASADRSESIATPNQTEELRALIGLILADAPEAERADALRVARVDADAALKSFRALRDDQRENAKWAGFRSPEAP